MHASIYNYNLHYPDKVDYTVSPQLVTISSTAPSVIEVDTFLDGLALEPDEQFTLRLEPVGGSAPRGLRESLTVTLVDSDGESNLKCIVLLFCKLRTLHGDDG